jgi:hypothetical protein
MSSDISAGFSNSTCAYRGNNEERRHQHKIEISTESAYPKFRAVYTDAGDGRATRSIFIAES